MIHMKRILCCGLIAFGLVAGASPAHAGLSCYVDTPAYDYFSPEECVSLWEFGPQWTWAVFEVDNEILALLGDSTSPTAAWSDPSCGELYPNATCILPIRAQTTIELSVILTFSSGEQWIFPASASYETH